MRKLRCFLDFTKEENWLRNMAKEGYEFKKVSWRGHYFEKSELKDTIIRIDYRTFKCKEDFVDYITLFKDSGWEHIYGGENLGLQYFKKVDENSDEDIFSDNTSKAGRYKKIFNAYITFTICWIPIVSMPLYSDSLKYNQLLKPETLFYTPDLWSLTGLNFLGGFLFELPLAIARFLVIILAPVLAIFYLFMSIKSYMLYKKYNFQ